MDIRELRRERLGSLPPVPFLRLHGVARVGSCVEAAVPVSTLSLLELTCSPKMMRSSAMITLMNEKTYRIVIRITEIKLSRYSEVEIS